LFSCFSGQFQV
jgi:hypothetical protein